ncbi:gag-polypeptide of LTR copia-type domain-containing protein [Phthorimaea operculella]|nr:gag-polypeptide of LTR copia-type domain-containing protein [Phthorimaea operculella]
MSSGGGSAQPASSGNGAGAFTIEKLRGSSNYYVREAKSAQDAWNKLAAIFEDRGLYRRVLLLRQLHRIEYKSYNSMQEYINAIMTIVSQLSDIGKQIEDDEVAEILLSGLPAEYDVLVMRVLISSKKKKLFCNYCKKEGHSRNKCFKLRKQKKDKTERAFIVTDSAYSVTQEDFVVDSGCSSHMIKNKNLLDSFKPNKSNVCIANNEYLESEGSGKSTSLPLEYSSDLLKEGVQEKQSAMLVSAGVWHKRLGHISYKGADSEYCTGDEGAQTAASPSHDDLSCSSLQPDLSSRRGEAVSCAGRQVPGSVADTSRPVRSTRGKPPPSHNRPLLDMGHPRIGGIAILTTLGQCKMFNSQGTLLPIPWIIKLNGYMI